MGLSVQLLGRTCRLELRDEFALTGDAFGCRHQFERKRQRTKSSHRRARLVQMPEEALLDVVAFADVHPFSRGLDGVHPGRIRNPLTKRFERERIGLAAVVIRHFIHLAPSGAIERHRCEALPEKRGSYRKKRKNDAVSAEILLLSLNCEFGRG